jgi:hypothetical protein
MFVCGPAFAKRAAAKNLPKATLLHLARYHHIMSHYDSVESSSAFAFLDTLSDLGMRLFFPPRKGCNMHVFGSLMKAC